LLAKIGTQVTQTFLGGSEAGGAYGYTPKSQTEVQKLLAPGIFVATLRAGKVVKGVVGAIEGAAVVERALTAGDIGLSGKGIAKLVGTVVMAGSTKIINVANIEAVATGALTGEIRGAIPAMLSAASAEGVQTLQITGTFGNAGLSEFVASQAAQYGGTYSSLGAVETITFTLR
jgi:hypothetical protein